MKYEPINGVLADSVFADGREWMPDCLWFDSETKEICAYVRDANGDFVIENNEPKTEVVTVPRMRVVNLYGKGLLLIF